MCCHLLRRFGRNDRFREPHQAAFEYAQSLGQVKTLLQHVAELNQITLDNKVIGIGKASDDVLIEPGR